MADQARWHRVEHLAQGEAAGRRHADDHLFVVRGAAIGQLLQHHAFAIDPLGVAGIAAADDLVDEAAIGGKIVEVDSSAQQQGVRDCSLEMTVGPFDRAILMGDASIVAGRPHAVVGTKGLVSLRQIVPCIAIEIAECGRQAVGPMLPRRPTERPESILQAFGQGNEALAAEHDVDVLEPAIGQTEVIETMIQRCARDRNTQLAHVCEVGEAELARLVGLAEDHLLLLAVDRPQGADTTFRGTTDTGAEIRMTSEHLLEDRHRA